MTLVFRQINQAKSALLDLDSGLADQMEKELDQLSMYPDIKIHISPHGFIFYLRCPKEMKGAIPLITTIHNGRWVPKGIEFYRNEHERHQREEDLFVGDFYLPLLAGSKKILYVSDHASRYWRDLNRPEETAVLKCDSLRQGEHNFHRFAGDEKVISKAIQSYRTFYKELNEWIGGLKIDPSSIITLHGHSMMPNKDGESRWNFCIAPSEREDYEILRQALGRNGFKDIRLNDPWKLFEGQTHFVDYMHNQFGGRSTLFETNRNLLLDPTDIEKKNPDFDINSKKVTGAIQDYLSKHC